MSAATALTIPQEQIEMLFTLWTRGETEERDSISVKKIYIDINDGYLVDGVIFSQIMYWHGNDKKGNARLSITRKGHLWLAKSYDDWFEECRVPARNAREAINRMVDRGLIEKFTWHFNGVPTIHLRVIHERFVELVLKHDPSLIRQKMSDKQKGKVSNRQKMSDGIDKKRQNQVTENVTSFNTETTTETTTKEPPTPITTNLEGIDQHEKVVQERGGDIADKKIVPIRKRDILFDAVVETCFDTNPYSPDEVAKLGGRVGGLSTTLRRVYKSDYNDQQLADKLKAFKQYWLGKGLSMPQTEKSLLPNFKKFLDSGISKPALPPADPNCKTCHGRGFWIDKSNQYNHKKVMCGCRVREGSTNG